MKNFAFRIRVNCGKFDFLSVDENRVTLKEENGELVYLKAHLDGQKIKDSEKLVLVGEGYSSEPAAQQAALEFEKALMVAFASVRVGVDFGLRSPVGCFTDEGLAFLSEQINAPVLNDAHGLMVFQKIEKTMFVSQDVQASRGAGQDLFLSAFNKASSNARVFTERERLAFVLFNAALFQEVSDARFVLLVMAIEALIDALPRSEKAIKHVSELIDLTKSSNLPDSEKSSMCGALQWLKQESIGQSSQRLVKERLGEKLYSGKPASKYISHIYQLRSSLVHGSNPYPDHQIVRTECAQLELFVRDLLCQPLGIG